MATARGVGQYIGGKVDDHIGFNATGIVLAAGTVSFLGNMKQAGAFPPNGVRVITATIILTILASIADNSVLAKPAKWLAILMLLSALLAYVPYFSNTKKGKKHG